MSEKALLKDDFGKGPRAGRPGVPLKNTALLGGIRDNDDTNDIFVRCEQKLIQRDNTFRTCQERRAEHLAAFDAIVVVLV